MLIVIKKPSECTRKEIESFIEMVRTGGQVKKPGMEWRVRRAHLLAFYYEKNTLAGILGVKQFIKTYKKTIFRKAGVPEEAGKYNLEMGWAFTLPEYRGRGIFSSLKKKLISAVGHENLYSTTSINNLPVQKSMKKFGFVKLGKPYAGRTSGRMIYIFVRKVR